jgi:hypothetical protein
MKANSPVFSVVWRPVILSLCRLRNLRATNASNYPFSLRPPKTFSIAVVLVLARTLPETRPDDAYSGAYNFCKQIKCVNGGNLQIVMSLGLLALSDAIKAEIAKPGGKAFDPDE